MPVETYTVLSTFTISPLPGETRERVFTEGGTLSYDRTIISRYTEQLDQALYNGWIVRLVPLEQDDGNDGDDGDDGDIRRWSSDPQTQERIAIRDWNRRRDRTTILGPDEPRSPYISAIDYSYSSTSNEILVPLPETHSLVMDGDHLVGRAQQESDESESDDSSIPIESPPIEVAVVHISKKYLERWEGLHGNTLRAELTAAVTKFMTLETDDEAETLPKEPKKSHWEHVLEEVAE